MFRKLRFQLTAINLSIILLLFLLLIASTYYLSQLQMTRRAEGTNRRLATDILDERLKDFPSNSLRFFIKTTPAGAILAQSSAQPKETGRSAQLIQQTLAQDAPAGTLTIEQSEYSYYKIELPEQPGFLLLFQDMENEKNIRQFLLLGLTTAGVVCLILSLGGSLYLANRSLVPIQRAWQQQKDFLADVSHELRTPLTVIQTNLEIVLDNPDETVASQKKWLTNIKEETASMNTLVNSLLFLARADSQQQSLDAQLFPLERTVAAVADSFQPLAEEKKIRLLVHATSSPLFYGDDMKIRQTLAILLDNALRHTPPAGSITVSLQASDTLAVVTVADNGCGIAPEHADKIFDRFYQVDPSRSHGGAGLGLAIAKWIVEAHQGTITVASQPGRGATFSLQLPLRHT